MENVCTILVGNDKNNDPVSVGELKKQLEKGTDEDRCVAMRQIITLMLSGENMAGILMTVIRFVLNSRHHTLKKLLLIFLEVVDKVDAQGKLLPEMILICNALRNDLNHPNEYVRGSTCRFLCKIKEVELLEPLVPSVRQNLEHRHSYVRRNAVLCLYTIFKLSEALAPDAPEVVYEFLAGEQDASCKRSAFIMLIHCAPERAVEYLSGVLDEVESMGDVMQFTVVELIRRLVRQNPALRGKYIRVIFGLLKSSSAPVRFEAAHTLVLLSSAPSAVRAAAAAYIELLCKEADNNVKLIVLDRLSELKKRHAKVLGELLLDVLRALATPSLDIRRKTLAIAMDLVSPKNIDEVVQVLKKEIGRTQARELEKQDEYRQMLIQAVHQCAAAFPDVAQGVVHMLLDFVGDSNVASAVDVVLFVREVIETYPELSGSIVTKLRESLDSIRSSKVFRAALWIVAEHSQTSKQLQAALRTLFECLGDPPFVDPEHTEDAADEEQQTVTSDKQKTNAGPKLNPDGTYASQSALMEEYSSVAAKEKSVPNLRQLLLAGDFYLGAVVASSLVKLVAKLERLDKVDKQAKNRAVARSLLVMVSTLRLGKSTTPPNPIDRDSAERISVCMRALMEPDSFARGIFVDQCRLAFKRMLDHQTTDLSLFAGAAAGGGALPEKSGGSMGVTAGAATANMAKGLASAVAVAEQPAELLADVDSCIKIRQLRLKRGGLDEQTGDDDEADLSRATGSTEQAADARGSKLSRVVQLTGFSDPVFAEACVTVHQYDVVLELTMINQTEDTLQNVCVELATLGDLKLVERPQYLTIGPCAKKTLKASIKVSSTETGIIFGNIVYDIAGAASDSDRNCVILADIHIDIMDYITPAWCTDSQFRAKWQALEWENRLSVNTNIDDVEEFLAHLIKVTHMRCLTPTTALSGKCGFIAANLFARSSFGEDALMNVSIEKQASTGKITGTIRVRAHAQGIALSLGDKVSSRQRRSA